MAEAAERADHLVGHEQHAVLVADLADPLEVAVGGGKQPPEFCTGSRNTAATVSGPSISIAMLDLIGGPAAERLDVVAVLGAR